MRYILFSLFLFSVQFSYAQWMHDDLILDPKIKNTDDNEFYLKIDALAFFKNAEYFQPFVKGETLPGARFTPKLGYQYQNKFVFEIGSSGSYYSGNEKKPWSRFFNTVYLKMQYDITENFHFTLGNYYGDVNHRLIEPLYKWQNIYTQNPESGAQLLYVNNWWFVDTWINWQRFIERNDPFQEILTFGLSSQYKAIVKDNFTLSFPLQFIINHRGGQIDTNGDPNMVLMNLASGIQTKWSFKDSFISSLGFQFWLAGYYDKDRKESIRPYNSGYGIYPLAFVEVKDFKFMLGYWNAKKFYSVDGEPLFSSFSPFYPDLSVERKSVIVPKLSYTKQFLKMLSFGAEFEVYYDTKLSQMDYSFGVHLKADIDRITLFRTK